MVDHLIKARMAVMARFMAAHAHSALHIARHERGAVDIARYRGGPDKLRSGNGRGAMFKRIDHIEIVTNRLEASEMFYTEVLGFTVRARDRIARPGSDQALNLVYLDLGGTTIELIAFEGIPVAPEPEKEHLGYRLMALEVEDMNEALAFLQNNGVDPVWGPMVRDTYARAEIKDPDGNNIELRQWF
jgi:glyoxylase I family protein